MSKPKKLSAAERAVRLAVEEETKDIRAELEAEKSKVTRLQSILRNIGIQAMGAVESEPVAAPSVQAPVIEEPPLPQGPSVDLNPADNMGEGRWA